MIQSQWIRATCLSVVLTIASGVAWSSPQGQQQKQKALYTSTEFDAFQAAHTAKDSPEKIKVLDRFAAQYPHSILLPDVYRDYYHTDVFLRAFPQTVEYADKFLAVAGETLTQAERLDVLYARSWAYFQGCRDSAFHTPEAYTKARDAAVEGQQILEQPQRPQGVPEALIPTYAGGFYNVRAIAEAGLKDPTSDSCKVVSAPDPNKFNRMINGIETHPVQ